MAKQKGGNSADKSVRGKAHPIKVPSVPVSFLTLGFNLGIALFSISITVWEQSHEHHNAALASFFHRKTVNPAVFMKVIQVLMLLGGLINFSRGLYAIFTRMNHPVRSASDAIGFVLFASSIGINVLKLIPLEKQIGELWTTQDVAVISSLQHDLLYWHYVSLVLLLSLMVQQVVSWKYQDAYEKPKQA